jgi:hypothetical protein
MVEDVGESDDVARGGLQSRGLQWSSSCVLWLSARSWLVCRLRALSQRISSAIPCRFRSVAIVFLGVAMLAPLLDGHSPRMRHHESALRWLRRAFCPESVPSLLE